MKTNGAVKTAIFIMAAVIAIETAYIISNELLVTRQYEAMVDELQAYLQQSLEREGLLGEMVEELLTRLKREVPYEREPKSSSISCSHRQNKKLFALSDDNNPDGDRVLPSWHDL